MIVSFACAETGRIFRAELSRRFPTDIQRNARRKLLALNAATELRQMAVPPGAGLGTIIEGNEISNLEIALYDPNASSYGKDLVIRNNYFHYVLKGIHYDRSSGTIGRIIATENVIDLATDGALADARGINLTGATSTCYNTLILRKNV